MVEFNSASLLDEDAATDLDNYDLEDDDEDPIELSDAEIVGDAVILTIADVLDGDVLDEYPVDNQDEAVLTITDEILDDDEDFDITFFDTTIPQAVDAEVVGSDTIKVYFSEPMKPTEYDSDYGYLADKDYFEVDDGDYFIKRVVLVNNNTEANIVLYSDLDEGIIEVNVDDLEDYAGFGVVSTDLTAKVVEDEEAPYVVGYKDASETKVTLVFNEDVELTEDADVSYIYHTNSKNTVDKDDPDDSDSKEFASDAVVIDGKEMTLKFSQNELPEGIAYIYIEDETVVDLWGNVNDDTYRVKIEVTVDTTAPEVEKVEQGDNEDEIIVTYNEPVDEESAEDKDNYTILDDDGEEIDIAIKKAELNSAGDVVTITMKEDLDSGDYSIVIEDVKDTSENKIADTTVKFSIDDKTKPSDFSATLYDAGDEEQLLVIDFGEKMAVGNEDYAIDDLEKYAITDGDEKEVLADYDGVELDIIDNGQVLEIMIPFDKDDDDLKDQDLSAQFDLSKLDLEIARVADAAGNKTKGFITTVNVTVKGDDSGVTIKEAKATSTDKIKVTFNEDLIDFEGDDLAVYFANSETDYTSDNDLNENYEIKISKSKVLSDSEVELTLNSKLNYDATYEEYSYVYVVVVGKESVNRYEEPLVKYDECLIKDAIAPALIDDGANIVASDGKVVKLEFTEPIDTRSISTSTFEVEDADVIDVKFNGDNTYEDTVYLILDSAVEVEYEITQKADIKDEEGNVVSDIETEIAADKSSVITIGDTEVTGFSRKADGTIEVDPTALTVSDDKYKISDAEVIADLKAQVPGDGGSSKVGYTGYVVTFDGEISGINVYANGELKSGASLDGKDKNGNSFIKVYVGVADEVEDEDNWTARINEEVVWEFELLDSSDNVIGRTFFTTKVVLGE